MFNELLGMIDETKADRARLKRAMSQLSGEQRRTQAIRQGRRIKSWKVALWRESDYLWLCAKGRMAEWWEREVRNGW